MPGEIYASGSTVAGNACVCGPQSPFGTQPINTLADLQHALSHVYMRFDTDPRSYSKKDYYYLLWVISRGLVHLYENEANPGQQGDVQEQLAVLQKLATELGEKYNQMVPVVTQLEKDVESLKAADVSARVKENSDDIDVLEGNVLDIVDRVSRVEEQARLLEKAIEQLSRGGGSADDLKTIVAGLQSMVVTLDGRVKALEDEERHEHANFDVLNGITAEKVAAWDRAEQNAKAYVDAEIAKIQMPSMEGYATEEWVQSQGYLTEHQDLGHLATKDEVLAVEDKANANADALAVLNGEGEGSVVKTVNDAISNVIAGAPGTFDTLKEIADYIANDQTGAAELAEKVATLEEEVENLKNSQPVIPDIPEQVVMTAGSGIEISEVDESSQISAVWTEKPLKVQVNIGGYSPDDEIHTGDDLISIIKKLLTKLIGVTIKEPSVRTSGNIAAVEYGETTADTVITLSLTDGQFVSADPDNYQMAPVALGCSLSNTVVKNGSIEVATSETNKVTISGFSLTEPTTLKIYTDISASTNTAKNNDGTVSDVSYAGVTNKQIGTISVTPFYRLFMGTVAKDSELTSDVIRSLVFKDTIGYNDSVKTLSSSYTFTNGDMIIACPSKFTLTDIKQVETGGSYLAKFEKLSDAVAITCGSTTCDYTIYKYQSGVEFNFNNIIFKKQ